MREECKGCYGPDLLGEHMFDCPTRIRGIETRLEAAEARVRELENMLDAMADGSCDEHGMWEEAEDEDDEEARSASCVMCRMLTEANDIRGRRLAALRGEGGK